MRTLLWTFLVLVLSPAVAADDAEQFPFDDANPALGHWVGEVQPPGGGAMFAALLVEPGGDGVAVRMTYLPTASLQQPCAGVQIEGRGVVFDLETPFGRFHFDGVVSDDGQRMTGHAAQVSEAGDADPNRATFELARSPRPTDLPEPMAFTGTLEVRGMGGLDLTLVFAETPGGGLVGHVDIPAQMLEGLPLVDVARTGPAIKATIPSPGVPATFDVELDPTEQRLVGMFRQAGMEIPVDLVRDPAYAFRAIPRPQHPTPPYPYEERTIVAEHPDGHRLAGTLTIPNADDHGPGPFPTAVLISGSGAQDRDEAILGHRPFLVVADFLTRRGIAVMRYDDRGVGESTGAASAAIGTTADFATDTWAIVQRLRTEPMVDPGRIGLIGHSEGGMIAPMVARDYDEIAFIVLLAGTGVPGRELLPLQMALGMKANGGDPALTEVFREQMETVFTLLLSGADNAAIEAAAAEAARTSLAIAGMEPTDETVAQFMQSTLGMTSSPWMMYFLEYDPAPALRAVKCPVLAVNGTLDLQVWHEQNLDAIERTLRDAGADVTTRRYDGLNHLFQPATTGSGAEYATIEITFDEGVMGDVADWILAEVGK